MTQSIKAIYDAILAAAKRNELIVVEPDADSGCCDALRSVDGVSRHYAAGCDLRR